MRDKRWMHVPACACMMQPYLQQLEPNSAMNFSLSNELEVPYPAFGVGSKWSRAKKSTPDVTNPILVESVANALESGFCHLDLAETYNTYDEVSQAFSELEENSTFQRSNVFITDKFWTGISTTNWKPFTSGPRESLEKSLAKLKVDNVSLYLLHSPFVSLEDQGYDVVQLWKEMEEVYASGKAQAIGVSNFDVDTLEQIRAVAKVQPMCNQIEFNPYLQNQSPGIVDYCKRHGILLSAYSPLTPLTKVKDGPIDECLVRLVEKYNKTPAQILLRWCLQRGIVPVTTSTNAIRIKEMADLNGFELDEKEVREIDTLGAQTFYRGSWHAQFDDGESSSG